jgi:hypothetical protein
MAKLAGVVQQLKQGRARAQKEVAQLDAAIKALGGGAGSGRGASSRRRLSAAARNRIAAAQRARWAKWKRAKKAR